MATIRVHTTQNVTLEYRVASIGDRIVATVIDYLVLLAWGILMGTIIYFIGRGVEGDSHPINYRDPAEVLGAGIAVLLGIIMFGPMLFYSLLSEIFLNGQSVGKKARHIRVVRLDGTAPRVGDYFLRWLLRFVDMFFYGAVAMITIAANGRGQRLGDLAAGTSVISLREQPLALPDMAGQAPPVGYQPVFAQAASLADHDASLLRRLLARPYSATTPELLREAALKTKALLHIYTDLDDEAFLHTVLRDHAYLAHEAAAR